MRFGPDRTSSGVTFRLWAPAARKVELILDKPHPMRGLDDGWYELAVPGADAGTLYNFRIDGEIDVPDPASHFQPRDVDGPSEIIDHSQYQWRAKEWRGRPWEETVFLELHVGTFTPGGTFQSA